MSVTNDMVASLRRPQDVMRRHLALGQREDRALIYLMASCVVFLISNLPVISRNAHLAGTDMGADLGATILAWLFVAPLGLYLVAAVMRVFTKALGCKASWFEVRLVLFWSLLASTPFILLNGLTAGLIGPGIQLNIIGALWGLVFLWVFIGGLRAACKDSA